MSFIFVVKELCEVHIVKKKCKFTILMINFDVIDRVITRLKQKKLKTKIAQKTIIELIRI